MIFFRERCRFSLTECGGRLYAVGGCAEAGEDDIIVESYDAPMTKSLILAFYGLGYIFIFSRERCRFSLTECGGRLYAVGGCAEAGEDDITVESYDPNTDVWVPCPGLPGK